MEEDLKKKQKMEADLKKIIMEAALKKDKKIGRRPQAQF
jgi:hypothetical protein